MAEQTEITNVDAIVAGIGANVLKGLDKTVGSIKDGLNELDPKQTVEGISRLAAQVKLQTDNQRLDALNVATGIANMGEEFVLGIQKQTQIQLDEISARRDAMATEKVLAQEAAREQQLQMNRMLEALEALKDTNAQMPEKIESGEIPLMLIAALGGVITGIGIGIAENMDDTQTLMNGFMRMAVDNAVLSGNLLIEVDETNLVPGQDLSVYPGKVFRRQGGAPGQAIFGTKFPNVAGENLQLFDKARVLADESTGFPSFAHGQTGVQGIGRTASGISMLMGAASQNIKNVIKNVDDYLLRPLGEGMFRFNMQFDFDPEVKGDLEVKARGTESLMANEVRSQRLMQFMQVASNPTLAPFAKFQYIIREIAKSLDLDPDKVTNNMSDAAIQAELMKAFQQEQQPQGAAPAGVNPMDTSGAGGGTIGTGQAPTPQEQGFSGNAGQQGAPQQAQGTGEQPSPMV